jgi:hypothetical protein
MIGELWKSNPVMSEAMRGARRGPRDPPLKAHIPPRRPPPRLPAPSCRANSPCEMSPRTSGRTPCPLRRSPTCCASQVPQAPDARRVTSPITSPLLLLLLLSPDCCWLGIIVSHWHPPPLTPAAPARPAGCRRSPSRSSRQGQPRPPRRPPAREQRSRKSQAHSLPGVLGALRVRAHTGRAMHAAVQGPAKHAGPSPRAAAHLQPLSVHAAARPVARLQDHHAVAQRAQLRGRRQA